MIHLYCSSDDLDSEQIEAELQRLVLAYKKWPLEKAIEEELVAAVCGPVLRSGDQICVNKSSIDRLLRVLEQEVEMSRIFQSDACLIDPELPGTCL